MIVDPLVRSLCKKIVGLRSINWETYIVDVMVSEFLLPWLDKIFNSFDPFCFCWRQFCRFQRFLWFRSNSIYHFSFVLICFKLLFKIAVFNEKGVYIQWKKIGKYCNYLFKKCSIPSRSWGLSTFTL